MLTHVVPDPQHYKAGQLEPRPGYRLVRQTPGTAVIDAEVDRGWLRAQVAGVEHIAVFSPAQRDFDGNPGRLTEMDALVAYLQRRHYGPMGRPLRSCHPRDLLDQVTALCRYRGIEPVITRELLDAACSSYFVDGPGAADGICRRVRPGRAGPDQPR